MPRWRIAGGSCGKAVRRRCLPLAFSPKPADRQCGQRKGGDAKPARRVEIGDAPAWRNGRRSGLKIRNPQGCGGSSPPAGISFQNNGLQRSWHSLHCELAWPSSQLRTLLRRSWSARMRGVGSMRVAERASVLRGRPARLTEWQHFGRERPVVQRGTRVPPVAAAPPPLDQHGCLCNGVEDLAAQQLVTGPGIEALQTAVLPRACC